MPNSGFKMLCTVVRKGRACCKEAGSDGRCSFHSPWGSHVPEGEVAWRSVKWKNPEFLNQQRKAWNKVLIKMANLQSAINRIVCQFERLDDEVTTKLDALKGKNGEGITIDKVAINLFNTYLKSAGVVAHLQDVSNRGIKMLGQQVTRERLQGLIQNLRRYSLLGLDDANAEAKQNLIQFMQANHKKLAPGIDPVKFGMDAHGNGAQRAINRHKRKLIAAFETGKLLSEELKEYQRPNEEKGDQVV